MRWRHMPFGYLGKRLLGRGTSKTKDPEINGWNEPQGSCGFKSPMLSWILPLAWIIKKNSVSRHGCFYAGVVSFLAVSVPTNLAFNSRVAGVSRTERTSLHLWTTRKKNMPSTEWPCWAAPPFFLGGRGEWQWKPAEGPAATCLVRCS